jgi:hypothetical protein
MPESQSRRGGISARFRTLCRSVVMESLRDRCWKSRVAWPLNCFSLSVMVANPCPDQRWTIRRGHRTGSASGRRATGLLDDRSPDDVHGVTKGVAD